MGVRFSLPAQGNNMNDAIFDKIIEWIFTHHNHHWLENDTDDNSFKCDEGDYPYVNSIELEDFIFKLAKKNKKKYFKEKEEKRRKGRIAQW